MVFKDVISLLRRWTKSRLVWRVNTFLYRLRSRNKSNTESANDKNVAASLFVAEKKSFIGIKEFPVNGFLPIGKLSL